MTTYSVSLPVGDNELKWCQIESGGGSTEAHVKINPVQGNLTINPDGTTSYTGKDGNDYTQPAGEDLKVIADDIIVLGKSYTVVWDYLGGTSGSDSNYTQSSIEYGSGASHTPAFPTKTNFFMDGWDKSYSYIVSDLTVYPVWKPNAANIIADATTPAQSTGGNWYTKPIDYNDDTNATHKHTLNYYDAKDGTVTITPSGGGTSPLVHDFDYTSHDVALTNSSDGNTTFATTPQGGTDGASTVTAQGIHDLEASVDEYGNAKLSGSVGGISFETVTDKDGNIKVTYTDSNGKETVVDAPYASHVLIDENGKLTVTTGSVDENGIVTLANGDNSVVLNDTNTTVTEKTVSGDLQTVNLSGYETINISADYAFTVVFDPFGGTLVSGDLNQTLVADTNATPPTVERNCSDSTAGCFTFAGWDSAYNAVNSDLKIKASWTPANGVVDSQIPAKDEGGNWYTKPLDYNTSTGIEHNTSLEYYDDASIAVVVSGGDKDGNPLVHTFSGYTDGHQVKLLNHSDGNTSFEITPSGQSNPSTITADGISPVNAKVDENGTATLSGSVNADTEFKVIANPDGTTTINYTNANGDVTTVDLAYKNDVVINADGTISASTTHGEVTINADGSTSFTDKENNPHTAPAGDDLNVTTDDVVWLGKTYSVSFKLNGGVLSSGSLSQSVAYASGAVAPVITRENYTLAWDKTFDYITADRIVTARWIPDNGVIDPQELNTTTVGNWHTKPIEYVNSSGVDQNTTLKYFDDGSMDVAMSGGNGDALVHTFSGYADSQTVELFNEPNGDTRFETTPNGATDGASTITAEGISPIIATVNETGDANLSGTTSSGSEFEVIIATDGTTTVSYTKDGATTTLNLPYQNDVIINDDGSITTSTKDGQEVTINSDGTTTYTGKDGVQHTQDAGETINVVSDDVLLDKSFSVTFDLNNGTSSGGGATSQTIVYGSPATAPSVSRAGHTFVKWDKEFSYITQAITVTAQWSADNGTISRNDIETVDNGSGWYHQDIDYTTTNDDFQNIDLDYYSNGAPLNSLTQTGGDGAALAACRTQTKINN